jgi:uncharacterized repeat protein (TIGR03803 family)
MRKAGGGWTEIVLHYFDRSKDGGNPMSGLMIDAAGNLYGTAGQGGLYDLGTVFKLTPSNGSWTWTTLYTFTVSDRVGYPDTGVVLNAGNLYGTTIYGGDRAKGNVFELTPTGGGWNFFTLVNFNGRNGNGPGGLTTDQAGNLYGITTGGGTYKLGTVYRLSQTNGVWKETVLHNFAGGVDGSSPYGNLLLDSSGNLYGVASQGGANNPGTVFEITP